MVRTIKDLKGGYLSQVVHKIARMMVEHNAIVVLEDLNFGFKRGRFRIEKQVYQKFEKALITKLNYLVFKERGMREPGGVLNAYQLTAPFESFEKLGKQTGFLFYVPAGYTSKIDPTTGFTNLLNTKKCTNAQSIRDFFLKFDSICYEAHRQAFAFSFDYGNFKTSQESKRKKWTVYTATRRLVYKKCENGRGGGYEEINPTAILSNALSKVGVVVCDGFDLLDYVRRLEPSRENAGFFQTLFYAFDRTLQMRNSKDDEDYIESPVLNGGGERFDSRTAGNALPKDADANGAYHIALKGLMLIKERMAVDGKADLRLEHKDWFRFVQELAERRFGT
jgi:CRISPR-associated protein Cpf1